MDEDDAVREIFDEIFDGDVPGSELAVEPRERSGTNSTNLRSKILPLGKGLLLNIDPLFLSYEHG